MKFMTEQFSYGDDVLSPGTALDLARGKVRGILSDKGKQRVTRSYKQVRTIVESGRTVYGINTGFGPLCDTKISEEETKLLQTNILKSHSVGMGEDIPDEVAALMLVLKLQALARGRSGVAVATLERILWHLDNSVIPAVPSQGSVGASGDLAPLAHLFLPLIGLGKVQYKGRLRPAAEVLAELDMKPLALGPKEGLALINGTQFIAAWGVFSLDKMANALNSADLIGAMSLESLLGSARPFLSELHELRPYDGNKLVAHRIRLLLEGSEIMPFHKNCGRVQDPYSLRCIPQVHGASRNAWYHLKEMLSIELNSVTDNPVILEDGSSVSGGNFHGQPLALPLDYAVIASSELGNISDRRTYLLLDSSARDLPRLLMKNTGINSGFMIPQYTSAALASENKGLCFPSSADSIPTSLGQEDHVSMGSISGRRLNQVTGNVEKILAVELLCAAQAFDFRHPLKSGPVLEACHSLVREHIDHADKDRVFGDDLETARRLIADGTLNKTAIESAASLNIDLNGEYSENYGLY
jgi:histidine ammonia-lyase